MTVNTTSIVSGPYAGNGVADTFSYTFKIEDKSQLAVYETDDVGVETLLTVDVDYTVADIGNDEGGTVTRVAGALPNSYFWLIRSDYKYTQLTAFESQGAFFPDLHENAFDKLTFLNQQILDKLGRGPVVSDTYTGTLPLSLPDPVSERFIRWKADLTGFENFDIASIDALAVSDFAKTYLDELTASATRAVLETKESFTDLDETPSSFSGQADKRVKVNAGETAVEFVSDTFDELEDTPVNKTGSAYKASAVNAAEGALEFVTVLSTDNYAYFRDEKASATQAGSSSAGYNTRVLNTTVTNNITGASLSSNQVTLAAGTYYFRASAPCYKGNNHKLELFNDTDTSYDLIGRNARSASADDMVTHTELHGLLTLGASKTFELRHDIETARATSGLGIAVSSGNVEVYAELEVWRLN
jgi:hypothetical protein